MKSIKIVPYNALPCEAREFNINGVDGDKSDFGTNMDCGRFDYEYDDLADENWACANNQFVPHEKIDPEVLVRYGMTEDEYRQMQDKIGSMFNIGRCGWCV